MERIRRRDHIHLLLHLHQIVIGILLDQGLKIDRSIKDKDIVVQSKMKINLKLKLKKIILLSKRNIKVIILRIIREDQDQEAITEILITERIRDHIKMIRMRSIDHDKMIEKERKKEKSQRMKRKREIGLKIVQNQISHLHHSFLIEEVEIFVDYFNILFTLN